MELNEAKKILNNAGFIIETRKATVFDGYSFDEIEEMRVKRAAAKQKKEQMKKLTQEVTDVLETLGDKIIENLNTYFNIKEGSKFYYQAFSDSKNPTSVNDFVLYINSPGYSEASVSVQKTNKGYKIGGTYFDDDYKENDLQEINVNTENEIIQLVLNIMIKLDGEEYNVK